MAQESEESFEGKNAEPASSPPPTASKKKPKYKYAEDSIMRISETSKSSKEVCVILGERLG